MSHRLASLALAAALTGCAATPPPALPRAAPAAKKQASKPPPAATPAGALLAAGGPCLTDTPENEAAMEKVRWLHKRMKEKKGAAFAEAVPVIKEILASPCYQRLALEPPVHLDFDGPLALETWWRSGGGSWLESFLFFRDEGPGHDNGGFALFIGPDARRILDQRAVGAKDASPGRRALAWLVCPDAEADCGKTTAGWVARADRAFEAEAYRDVFYLTWQRDMADETLPIRKPCEAKALAAEEKERFRVLRTCLEDVQLHQWAMPLGRFRSPDAGWLVVRGRRGHYAFCDELRAYDLATGTAYVAQSCSGLEFGNDGMVDNKQVDAARKIRVKMGAMSADNLRELAFAMLLAPEVERDLVLDARYFTTPPGITPVLSAGPRLERFQTQEARTSADTALTWTLVRGGAATNGGSFGWPRSWNVAEAHIGDLLAVAEGGFVEGCPAAPLPPRASHRGTGAPVSVIDASPDSVDETDKALEHALWTAKPPATCASAAPAKP
jgi:hypothetical protein